MEELYKELEIIIRNIDDYNIHNESFIKNTVSKYSQEAQIIFYELLDREITLRKEKDEPKIRKKKKPLSEDNDFELM